MPELPEVETVARGLRLTVLGRRILSVTLRKTDFIDDPSLIERHLPGRRIEAVERYGKFMLLRLSAAQGEENSANADSAPAALLVHLGMTGHIASTAVASRGKNTPTRASLWMMGENCVTPTRADSDGWPICQQNYCPPSWKVSAPSRSK